MKGVFLRRSDEAMPEFDTTSKVILVLFILAFLIMIYSVIPWNDIGIPLPQWNWWFGEFTALFLGFAILIGIVGRLGEAGISETFIDGARDMLGVALVIGSGAWHQRNHEQRPDHRHHPVLG